MLKLSTATKYVTPDEACYLGGYSMRTEKFTGILDDLKCTADVLCIDGKCVVWCDVEILMVTTEIVEYVKERLHKEYAVEPDLVTVAAIHTHAAPEIRSSRLPMYTDADETFWKRYNTFLKETICATVKECFDKGFCEVEASFKTVSIEGFYGNRNGIGKPEDKDVTVIKFTDKDKNVVAAAINISCHPTVLGAANLMVSGDLLGYISRAAKEKLGVYPVMMQGAAGDMSNRNFRKGHDETELRRTGDGIAAQIFASADGFTKLTIENPSVKKYNYHKEYDIDAAQWEELRNKTQSAMDAESDYDKNKILKSSLFAINMKLNNPHIVANYNAAIVSLGDLVICKIPGEMFSRFGVQIKKASAAKLTLVWGYADDYAGYMADEGEYGKTYESMMSPLPKGGTEQITKEICEIIAE